MATFPVAFAVCAVLLFLQPCTFGGPEDYACPLGAPAAIRQGDAIARTGGRFDSDRASGKRHGALDLNAKEGDAVFAIRSGRAGVAQINWGAMGNTVIIDHGDGEYSIYGHLKEILVKESASIEKGVKIGTVGYTGNAKELKDAKLPPHLHFALVRAGKSGLAEQGKPLRKMKEWGDYWQDLGAEVVGPINPSLIMGNKCWIGSTTVGAPGEN